MTMLQNAQYSSGMLTNTPQRPGPGAGSGTADAWDEIERLVREVAELARADVDTLDFYQGVLERLSLNIRKSTRSMAKFASGLKSKTAA